MGRWCLILATLAAAVGVASIAEVQQINTLGVAVFAAPYVAVVGLTVWAGQHHSGAAAVGAAGAGVMASLSWWEATHRQTEGYEWEFNNAMQFACCCGADYLVFLGVAFVVLVLARQPVVPMPPASGQAAQDAAQVAENRSQGPAT